ncbi:hypothetical protein Tco_0563865 [Tanacetum coccineum]
MILEAMRTEVGNRCSTSGFGVSAKGIHGPDIGSGGFRNYDTGGVTYDMDADSQRNQNASQANPYVKETEIEVEIPTQDEIPSQVTNEVLTEVHRPVQKRNSARQRLPSQRIINRNLSRKVHGEGSSPNTAINLD